MKKIFTLSFLVVFSLSFSQTFILPSTGVQSTYSGGCPVGTCSGTLLDPGGAGNYSNNINQIYQTFCPTTPGNCIQVTFSSYNTEAGFDYLTIGNGPAQNSAVFTGAPANASGQIWGTPGTPFSYTANNTSGCLTFRFNSDFTGVRAGFTASLSCVACAAALPAGNSDACASTFLCSNLGINDVSNGPGTNPTEGCGGASCVTGENYSNWYTFSIASSGSLTFTVDPNNNPDDFDYALYGPNTACGALGAPIRCSYAANTSNTGLGNGAVDVSEDVSGNGWTAPLNVTAGETYRLLVNNWTAGGLGFNLLFGGTAGIGTLPPAVTSTSICNGSSTVLTATPVASGGTYTWTPGPINSQSISVSPTSTQSYSVAYSLAGCTSTAAVATVTVVNLPVANAGSGATLTCTSPSTVLSGSGGGTYAWSGPGITGGGTTANPTVNAPGNYSLNVTASGCTSTVSTVSVAQNTTAPSPTASNSTTLTCSVTTAALTGGPASGVTYQWSGPGFSGGTTSQNATATAAGNYTLKVTDAVNGCTATAVTTVSQNTTAPTPGASNATTLTCNTTTASLTGTGGGTYSWSGPGIVSGGTTANPVVNMAGSYSVIVTAANGCTATANTTVSQNTTAPTPGASNATTLTCNTTTASLTGTGGGTYNWSGPGIVSGGTTANPVVNAPGSYSVVVTAANGCTATANTTVSQNTTAPTAGASNSTTLTCTTTTASLTGTGGTSYSWSGPGIVSGGATANPVVNAPGTYSVVVTAANGCTATANTTVSQNTTAPTAGASNSTTLTCTTTTVSLTGTGGTSYSWSGPGIVSGGASANPVVNAPGTYSVVVTAANGCTATANTTVSQNITPPSPTASNATTLTCAITTVALSGGPATGVNYQWSGPGFSGGTTSQNAIGTAPGTYTLKVTDSVTSCTAQATTVVSQNITPPSPTASNSTTLTCATTTAALTGTGGGSYSWSGPGITGGATTASPTVNLPGNYVVTVTAANGCTATANTTVSQNTTAPSPTASNSGSLTCSATTVTLTGTNGVSYSWTGPGIISGGTTANPVVDQIGNYVVTATAANGCTATANTTVSQNTIAPTVTMPGTQTITCASPTVSLIGSAGPSSCTPVWTGGVCGGSTTYSAQACSPNTYTLTVTDPSNGCVNSGTVDVVPSVGIPVVSASNTGPLTCATTTVEVSATTTMTPVSYSWTGPGAILGSSTTSGTVGVGGTYQCVVTNTLTGCSSTVTTLVNTNTTVPTTTINVSGMLTCSVTSVDLTGPAAGMTYTWLPQSVNTQTTSAATAGPCTLIVTDPSNGCTFTTTATVAQNTTAPTGVNAGSNQTLTCGTSSVTLSGSITTPTNATINWTGASVCGTATSLSSAACSAGVYTLTATDGSNGCIATSTVEVFPNAGAPTATISSTALTIDCNNATQSVTVTSTPSTDVTYTWNTPPSGVSANGDMATFNSPNTYICTVTNTISNCSTPVQVVVTTNTTVPALSISGTKTVTCSNPTAVISTTASGVTYTWTGSSAVVSGQGTGAVTVNASGDYSVTVTDAVNGCTNTATSHIDSDTNVPTVTIDATSTNSIITCQNPTVTLTASVTPSGTYSYTWAPSGNGGVNETVTGPGLYNVIVLNAATGCTATAAQQFTVTGNTTPPTVATSNTTMPCGSPSVAISAIASNVTYNWTTSGTGTILSGATTSNPVAGTAGPYVVTVTDNTNGCTNTGTVIVTSVSVTAAFSANPTSGTAPLFVNFTNQTPGTGNIYSWSFGDDNNNSSSLTNPDHTYNTTGTYTVVLLVTDAGGLCSATASVTIDVFANSSIIVPNVFTPNGDGKNDVFKITTTGMKELNCEIFNRWGTKVANISGINGSWDGNNVNDGTFFYILTATGFDGTEYKQQGYLNVFK